MEPAGLKPTGQTPDKMSGGRTGYKAMFRFLPAPSSLTPILSIIAVIGLFVARRGKHAYFFHWWLAAMILFIIIVGYGNRHPWYQLPLVPIAAAFAGAACAFVGSKFSAWRVAAITLSVLVASSFLVLACVYVRPLYRPSAVEL